MTKFSGAIAFEQVWCCTSPGGSAALFLGYGKGKSCLRIFSGSWLKGDQRLAVSLRQDEINITGMKVKSAGSAVRLIDGFQRAALQSDSRVGVGVRLPKEEEEIYGSDLQGFAQRVAACNEGRERKVEFLPFMVGKDTLGYIHYGFAQHLKRFPEVFSVESLEAYSDGARRALAAGRVSSVQSLSSPQQRTAAVQGVLEALKIEGLIPGWRDELQPVKLSYGASPFLLMERAAFPLFGAKSYGVHINGYVNIDGEKYLWVAKRSDRKQTFPGMLDHIVAGGQPEGISAKDNVIKECDEEAAIPLHLAKKAVAVGAVSYEYVMENNTSKRDVLFCYDLELPRDFEPYNKDGEVQSFVRLPISEVASIISKTERYKPNCALVVIDFLIRHGYITPEQKGYLSLLQSLRIGEL
ncbi:unnamed protein product [Calypogeia fissa]